MKNIKKISVFLTTICIIFSVFCCTASAAKEYTGYIVDTDIIYAELPNDYELSYVDNYYYFTDSDYNSIVIEASENKTAPEGITKLTEDAAVDFFFDSYLLEGDESYADYYKLLQVKAEKTVVNGMSAYVITGKFSEEGFVYPFCSFILATQENVFMITYEQTEDEELEKEDIKEVLASLAVNGTYFEGDIPTINHDFSNAVPYKDALAEADKALYSDDGFYSDDILGYGEETMGEAVGFAKIILILFFIVPFVIVSIIAVIMIILYIKNKKTLNSYEEKFGPIEMFKAYNGQNINFNNSYTGNNSGVTTGTGYVPYVQNPQMPAQQASSGQSFTSPDVQSNASVAIPEIKKEDIVTTGSYPVIKEENSGQTENNQ